MMEEIFPSVLSDSHLFCASKSAYSLLSAENPSMHSIFTSNLQLFFKEHWLKCDCLKTRKYFWYEKGKMAPTEMLKTAMWYTQLDSIKAHLLNVQNIMQIWKNSKTI